MKKHKPQLKRWRLATLTMFCIAFSCCFFLKFDVVAILGMTFIENMVFINLGEQLVKVTKGKRMPAPHMFWGIATTITFIIAMFLINEASYVTQESYGYWLSQVFMHKLRSVDFEVGTIMLVNYGVFTCFYGETVWKLAKKNIYEWFPSLCCLIIGVGIVLVAREGFDHDVRTMTLVVCGIMIIGYLILKDLASSEKAIVYHIRTKRYITIYMMFLLLVVGIGITVPECQVLPGTKWVRQIAGNFKGSVSLREKIPTETSLDDDMDLSDAKLFEVKTAEPIYLRSIAYSNYQDGTWRIEMQDESADNYINFKPQYLEAEYSQTQSLLDEIAYQNSQNERILPEYAAIANYESSVAHKKQYTVIQNPINRINYFTVNGMTRIKDKADSPIYYFHSLNNCYFYGETLVEPDSYIVEYYDHVPKMGSREYLFLRNINAVTWEKIYEQVVSNRNKYLYYYRDLPKLLLTYTPMVQYKSAQKNFLQIPSELVEPLSTLTKQITMPKNSDWANAEAICNYLKENFNYKLMSKKESGDPIYQFLFESKEGICQEFASSMTLMCRSIGIPAKYVTGYLVTNKDSQSGNYIVREKDAHAFVEVYIAGYGWMNFDPTPASASEENKEEEIIAFSTTDYIRAVCLIGAIIILSIFSKGGLGYFQEKCWQFLFGFWKPEKQIDRLMLRSCLWLNKLQLAREDYETLTQYADRLKEKELDITWIVHQYEAYKYGGIKPDKNQIKISYAYYKALKGKLKNK